MDLKKTTVEWTISPNGSCTSYKCEEETPHPQFMRRIKLLGVYYLPWTNVGGLYENCG